MKHILLAVLTLFILCYNCISQDEPSKGFKIKTGLSYKAIINDNYAGYLVKINDSSINLTSTERIYGSNYNDKSFQFSDLSQIALNRTGSGRRGALIGAGIGLVTGALIGLASYKKPTGSFAILDYGPGGSSVIGGFLGGVIGSLTGFAIGSHKHRYAINKDILKLGEVKNQLLY